MNEHSIYLIHSDILKLIPDCYRMWQLLRLTCSTMYHRLGEYHIARDMVLLHNGLPITYGAFMRLLINAMSGDGQSRLSSMTLAIARTHSSHSIYEVTMKYTCGLLTFYRDNYNIASIIAHRSIVSMQRYITIGKNEYYTRGQWIQCVRSELPELLLYMHGM